jgi:RNA polymerase sigma factor (sigma-70 family)
VTHASTHAEPTVRGAPAPPPSVDFNTIYRENLQFVVGVLRHTGVPSGALRDVCHEVFVRVHQTLDRYDPARPIRGWLHGVAFNVAREYRRARRRESLHDELPESLCSSGIDPERRALLGEEASVIDAALAAMSAERRTVFEMHHVLGMTIPEIAAALGGCPTDTLYARLYAAEELVEKSVSRYRRLR